MFGEDNFETIAKFKRVAIVVVFLIIIALIVVFAWNITGFITPNVKTEANVVKEQDTNMSNNSNIQDNTDKNTNNENTTVDDDSVTENDVLIAEQNTWQLLKDPNIKKDVTLISGNYTPTTQEELNLCEGVLSWLTIINVKGCVKNLVVNLDDSSGSGVVIYDKWVFECSRDAYNWFITDIYKTESLTKNEIKCLKDTYTIVEKDGKWLCVLK